MRKFAMPLKCSKFDRDGQQVKCIKAPCDEIKSWWNLEACLNFTKQNNLLNAHKKMLLLTGKIVVNVWLF